MDYLFRDDIFVGISIPVFGNDRINKLIRIIDKKNQWIGSKKHQTSKYWRINFWRNDDEYMVFSRYSFHLGELNFYCKEEFERLTGGTDMEIIGN